LTDHFCPSCDASLPGSSINIGEGVALCPSCGKLSRLSDVIEYERPSEEVVNNPPSGCSLRNDFDETIIRISLRSLGGFIGSLFVCLFWASAGALLARLLKEATAWRLFARVMATGLAVSAVMVFV